MKKKIPILLLLISLVCVPVFGVSTYMGLQPGLSTRGDVEKVLRQPIKAVSATVFEYALPSGPGQIFVEFRAEGSIVERIERVFPKPVSREGMIRTLKLPESPTGKLINKEGRLVEYFGGIKVLALTYDSADPSSGVVSLGYCSLEFYENAMDRVRNPRVEYDPNACRNLFTWARSEEDAAKRAKDIGRRQSVMEIMILSQRGDCEKAQNLAAGYKARYR